jgi:hypothetical protein
MKRSHLFTGNIFIIIVISHKTDKVEDFAMFTADREHEARLRSNGWVEFGLFR